jgi:zeaxanthin glucosyltransferase
MPVEEAKWHFGVLSFAGTGHLNPLMSLSRELVLRGHRVTFFDKLKAEAQVRDAGFDFVPVGEKEDSGKEKTTFNGRSAWSEISAMRSNLARIQHDVKMFLEETPAAVSRAGVNALLIDEVALAGPTVAQLLRLPYFIISTSVPHRFGWRCSSWFFGYRYSKSWLSWIQSVFLELSVTRIRGPVRSMLDDYRRRAGLGQVRTISKDFPCLAHIGQLPKCLDRPRRPVPKDFHYKGSFEWRIARPHVAFPWYQFDGRPILYVSLGTTRNVQTALLRMIAKACEGLDLQLVISLGNRFAPDSLTDLPGRPVVTKFAPQLDILKVAHIVVTHGGSNTVFEALAEGKPMIVIPLAYDQPAMAALLARLHLVEVLPVMRLSARRVRAAVEKILRDRSYHDAAQKMQTMMRSSRGEGLAADLIEKTLNQQIVRREAVVPALEGGSSLESDLEISRSALNGVR